MTQWIEITRTRQNGEPITRSIKIEGMDEEVWFTDKAVAEVTDNVADLLASQNDFINKISAPSSPGTYYEEANANQSITISIPDGSFSHLSAESFDVDAFDITDIENADPLSVASLDTDEVSSTTVDAEEADISEFDSSFSMSFTRVPNKDNYGKSYLPKLTAYPVSWVGIPSEQTVSAFIYICNDSIYRTPPNGEGMEYVGRGTRSIDHASMTMKEHYLTIADGGEARFFINGSDYASGTSTYTKSGVHSPYEFGSVSFNDDSNDWGVIWAEYQGGDAHGGDIIRLTDSGGFSTPLSMTGSDIDHWHGIDHDPYNEGRFIAYSGDDDPKVQWWESTDYGQTWSQISSAGGSQLWRTLRIVFTENYLYWASDTPSGALYRAPRGDLGNYEMLYDMTQDVPKDVWAYGACRFRHPNGIFIAGFDDADNGYDSVPSYFYDLDNDTMRIIDNYKLETGYSRAGIRSVSPYPLNNGVAAGKGKFSSSSLFDLDPLHIRVQKLMG